MSLSSRPTPRRGTCLDTFLRNHDPADLDRDYAAAVQQADGMIANRFAVGCDLTRAHPDWMIAYLQGVAVAYALDVLVVRTSGRRRT